MRMKSSVFAAALLLSAVPSVSFGQIVIPYTREEAVHVDRLDHVLPVATVTRSGDAIALADPTPGDGFVLGAAKLDLKDPDHPMLVFTISNGSDRPIPLSSVDVHVATVNARTDDGALSVPCGYYGWMSRLLSRPGSAGAGDTTLRPGATVTVAMPVGPHCGADRNGRPRPNVGFLVHLTSDGTHAGITATEDALLRSAFEQLRTQAKQ